MLPPIAIDYETPYGKDFSVVDLGYYKYARDRRCIPYLISVCDGVESWAGEPKDFNFASLKDRVLLSHNSAFDEEISLAADERKLFSVPGLSKWNMDHWFCTLNMSAFLWNVRSLKDACEVGLGIEVSKSVRDRAKDKSPEDMKREGWWGDMLKYGRQDVEHCHALWTKHGDKWPALERRLSRLTIDQGRHGVGIDVRALDAGITHMQRVIFNAQLNLPWVARGRPAGSPIGIAEECRAVGIMPPPVKAHDPEAAEEWEKEYSTQFKFVLALRNLRKAKKTLATLETIKLRLREDATVAFSLKYAGTITQRWSGDSGWNLQNMNKEPLLIDADFSFIFDKERVKAGNTEFAKEHSGERAEGVLKDGTKFFDFRGLIVARPGMTLGPTDEGQIEPRCLNWLANNHQLLKMLREGFSIYEAHARATMDWAGGELKSSDAKLYSLAKARVLGGGYGAGWEKFILIAMTMAGLDITEGDEQFALAASVDQKIHTRRKAMDRWYYDTMPKLAEDLPGSSFKRSTGVGGEAERCVFVIRVKVNKNTGEKTESLVALPVYGMRARITVEEFRKSNHLIVALWSLLQSELRDSVGSDLTVGGPNGLTLIYRDIQETEVERIDKDTGATYKTKRYTYLDGYKRKTLHGPLLTENLTQWVARNVFAEHMLAMHDALRKEHPEQGVLFSVHDEAVPEIFIPENPKAKLRELEAFLSVTPAWMPGLPLKAEGKIRPRYFK
jgi:hypothetical protein